MKVRGKREHRYRPVVKQVFRDKQAMAIHIF
jgi:hypothetical protein